MSDFERSYLGRLRRMIGSRLVLMPGTRCVLSREDGFLLMHLRGDTRQWSLPGGAAEEGQSLLDTVIREVTEETGLTPVEPVAWGHSSDPAHELVVYPNGDRIHAFALNFWAGRWTGTPHVDGIETLALDWFDPNRLPDDVTPAHRRALGFWLEHRRDGLFKVF